MAMQPWANDVRYYHYTPATIDYDFRLDAFYIARADVRSQTNPHILGLVVSITMRNLSEHRITLDMAIARARVLLDELIEQHRVIVDSLDDSSVRVFDFAGTRVR